MRYILHLYYSGYGVSMVGLIGNSDTKKEGKHPISYAKTPRNELRQLGIVVPLFRTMCLLAGIYTNTDVPVSGICQP